MRVLLLTICLYATALLAFAQEVSKPIDKFTDLAIDRLDYQNRNLEPVTPPKLERQLLPMDASGTASAFQPAPKMTMPEQARAELLRQRELYAPFLKDLAPSLDGTRIHVPLETFDWRVETAEDRTNLAGTLAGQGKWEQVKIPHFGPPMGRASTYYRTTFDVTQEMLDKGSLFVSFKGVDYKAHVFVNGMLLGSHEGIFSPFEFAFTPYARVGENVLFVKVDNDFIMAGNNGERGFLPNAPHFPGDKVYANVGPCWDEPEIGWHHCPPGMGIYQDVSIEARRPIHVHDVFVRPMSEDGQAEAWVEVFNRDPSEVFGPAQPGNVAIELSVFGQNFPATVFEKKVLKPLEGAKSEAGEPVLVRPQSGVNCYKIPFSIPNPRLWTPDSPWLYQIQVRLLDKDGKVLDTGKRQFGMRTFRMEFAKEPRGRMYLNGQAIKLRGGNTQGALQQCVIRRDWQQLIDDILLAKITHMNFMRLTQMPPQSEVYDYLDRLGLLVQTDLPTSFWVRRNQFCEVVRQAEEMERFVRSHPSNIMVTYINEAFGNGGGEANRNLTRPELTNMFEAADFVVHMANPDRITKAVDGDYDPPGPGLPDNHCYCAWYNGHGVDIGKLHKGFWLSVKPGWVYGCGEYGVEGLNSEEMLRKHCPKEWFPQTAEEDKTWTPDKLPAAQTGSTHYAFFDTQHSIADWVRVSQAYQAWSIRLMTEAFRRAPRMHSMAVHLFIDAFPKGWMKAIIDSDRTPKPAWFAYRDALTPLAVNLRSDRHAFFAGEPIELEAWVCNDRNDAPRDAKLHYQLECDGKVLQAGSTAATIPLLDSAYQGTLRFQAPATTARTTVTARLGLVGADGKVLHDNSVVMDVFPRSNIPLRRLYVIGKPTGKAAQLAGDLGATPVFDGPIKADDAVLIDDVEAFGKNKTEISKAVRDGAIAVFLELPNGKFPIGGEKVAVDAPNQDIMIGASPGGLHFVSRDTGHPLVEGFLPNDFKFWYNAKEDRPTPLLDQSSFLAEGWEPILTSYNKMAAGWKSEGKGHWCICQIELAGRIAGNPVAAIFAQRLVAKAAAR